MRLAEFHQADRTSKRERAKGRDPWHDPHGSALDARRQPSRPRVSRRAKRSRWPALLHKLSLAAVYSSRRYGSRRLWCLPEPSGGREMSEERAVLAGGCFWGVQDLFRRYKGILSTRV